MNPRARLMTVVALLAIGAVVAFAATQRKPTTAPPSGSAQKPRANCVHAKPPAAMPAWFPNDLPLPDGTTAMDVPAEASGYRRVVLDTPRPLTEFVRFALSEWKQQGWALGRGEAEPGEAEDNFVKNGRYGIFRAQSVMCDDTHSWLLIVVNDPKASNAPTPGFNRFSSASPSPLQ